VIIIAYYFNLISLNTNATENKLLNNPNRFQRLDLYFMDTDKVIKTGGIYE